MSTPDEPQDLAFGPRGQQLWDDLEAQVADPITREILRQYVRTVDFLESAEALASDLKQEAGVRAAAREAARKHSPLLVTLARALRPYIRVPEQASEVVKREGVIGDLHKKRQERLAGRSRTAN